MYQSSFNKIGFNYFIFMFLLVQSGVAQSNLKLWYRQPAERWMSQALPIGNGKIGGMVFGGIKEERIQFNEKSLWSGKVNANENPELIKVMPALQELWAKGDIVTADSIYKNAGYLKLNMGSAARTNYGSYQPFGDIKIHFKDQHGAVLQYQRELDLSDGTVRVNYNINGVNYKRTYFCSYPDQVMVIHLTADKPGKLSVDIEGVLAQLKDGNVKVDDQNNILYSGVMLESGMKYAARLKVITKGQLHVSGKQVVSVNNANEITLVLAANTNYQMQWPQVLSAINPSTASLNQVTKASRNSYEQLLKRHISNYHALFARVSLQLADSIDRSKLPTDERLRLYMENNQKGAFNGADPGLEALLFQYGRYLLITSSRGNNLPANLQGIWNDNVAPPWDSDYHTDINLQMNYWLAGVANLGDCFTPLVKYVNFLRRPGRTVAKKYFATKGFFIQLYSNPWGYAAPRWLWPGASGWLCQNLYDHFLFSGDAMYLKKEAYPIMKEACEFYLGILKPYKEGKLAVMPSSSPEINFLYDNGKDYRYSAGAAIDQQIVQDLFTNTIEAALILKTDAVFISKLSAVLQKLSNPVKITKIGTIQEWIEPWPAVDTTHRHLAQLYALYPGRLIDPAAQPKLADAASKTILQRGYGFTEWATTWRMLFWARLHQPEQAHTLFKFFISRSTNEGIDYFNTPGSAGVYDNLLSAHSPFNVDGNMGFTAAVAELLLQSHQGNWQNGYRIEFLPALPLAWPSGNVHGLKARGGFEVDIYWKDHQLIAAKITSGNGGIFRLKVNHPVKVFRQGKEIPLMKSVNDELVFSTQKGFRYELVRD